MLKSLIIYDGSSFLESLEPLSACKQLESLTIHGAYQISDLSPLSSCPSLKKILLKDSQVSDLSPLSTITLLEELNILHYGTPDKSPISLSFLSAKVSKGLIFLIIK